MRNENSWTITINQFHIILIKVYDNSFTTGLKKPIAQAFHSWTNTSLLEPELYSNIPDHSEKKLSFRVCDKVSEKNPVEILTIIHAHFIG